MSVPTDSSTGRTVPIFVRLLDEGTEVSRPTQAVDIGNGLFRVLETQGGHAEDEIWEFSPGSIVRVEKRVDSNGEEYLLAMNA